MTARHQNLGWLTRRKGRATVTNCPANFLITMPDATRCPHPCTTAVLPALCQRHTRQQISTGSASLANAHTHTHEGKEFFGDLSARAGSAALGRCQTRPHTRTHAFVNVAVANITAVIIERHPALGGSLGRFLHRFGTSVSTQCRHHSSRGSVLTPHKHKRVTHLANSVPAGKGAAVGLQPSRSSGADPNIS